jgi:hypothetical protein
VLTTHPQAPEVSQATVGPNLFQSLEVITQLRIDTIRQNLRVLAIHDILLSVQEPRRDFELSGILDNSDNALKLVRVQFTGTTQICERVYIINKKHIPLVEVNIRLLADKVGITTPDTLDLRQSVHNLALSVDISVE